MQSRFGNPIMSPVASSIPIPINPEIILVLIKKKGNLTYKPNNIKIGTWQGIISDNNKIIRNAEKFVLTNSKNSKLVQKCIDYDRKCLELKHYEYILKKRSPHDKINVKKFRFSPSFKCRLCNSRFNSQHSLNQHLKDKHKIFQ